MIERVIENWLDKVGERSFENAFCAMLMAEGYTVLHLTKHRPTEMGKDVIAIAPDKVPCVFQLKTAKGGVLTLQQYRKDVEPQLASLVEYSPEHPSISNNTSHRSYLVTNGTLAEETIAAIRLQNDSYVKRGTSFKLRTKVRGELLKKAQRLSSHILPKELPDFRDFISLLLTIYLSKGKEVLPKQKLCELLQAILNVQMEHKKTSKPALTRRIAAAAMIVAILTNEYAASENNFAIIEAWSCYLGFVLHLLTKHKLAGKIGKGEIDLAVMAIRDSANRLLDEAADNPWMIEGDPLTDAYAKHFRVPWLLGIASTLPFIDSAHGKFIVPDVLPRHSSRNTLWGEAVIPYFIPLIWELERVDQNKANNFLLKVIEFLCVGNSRFGSANLPNPYYTADEVLKWHLGLEQWPNDSFAGISFYLLPLVNMAVRRNLQSELQSLWPHISKMSHRQVNVKEAERFAWRTQDCLDQIITFPAEGKWEELVELSIASIEVELPEAVIKNPILLLLMLQAFPHRVTRGAINFLDKRLSPTLTKNTSNAT